MGDIAVVWFRNDLRLLDNPALSHACKTHDKVIALYIYDQDFGDQFKIGAASKCWLHYSLLKFQERLNITLRQGDSWQCLGDIIEESGAGAVYWNRLYEPEAIRRDTEIKDLLKNQGVHCESFNGSLLFEPWEVQKKSGGSYGVFTPFWKRCREKGRDVAILPHPDLKRVHNIKSCDIKDFKLLPDKNWGIEILQCWEPGEKGGHKRFDDFIEKNLVHYAEGRNILGKPYTSLLSAHLHFGEISPNYIWNKIHELYVSNNSLREAGDKFLSELGWREFSYHLLYHFPEMPFKNYKSQFDNFHWEDDSDALQRWKEGQTGYPIVDAGMRELWQTGYMHNRVRMITASFLIKDLLIDWRRGQDWFWDCLIDADLANNSCSWQWVAGSGADASPYFRIFNPVLQGEKFDLKGEYVRKWVPELKDMADKYIHKPWEAPSEELNRVGVKLGDNYPKPIVDHAYARKLALQLYKNL